MIRAKIELLQRLIEAAQTEVHEREEGQGGVYIGGGAILLIVIVLLLILLL